MPLIKGENLEEKGRGIMFWNNGHMQYGFRQGKWKYVNGTKSCGHDDCKVPLLYDLSADLNETIDLSKE